uniref:Gastrokine-2 n=1 Tax=Catagonus wagneri TaxID=51154 RepID=A0A8C3X7Q0_9CETA
MKILVVLLVALTIFGTQSHGNEVYNFISSTDNGGQIQETMTIDNEKNTVTVNIQAGSCSSTTVFDYKHGYIASRVLSRRACYIMKMNHKAIPAADELKRSAFEKQALKNMFSNKYIWVKYNPLRSLITNMNWFLFGSPIKRLCEGVPLYKAEVVDKTNDTGAGACAKVGLLGILGISVCADLHF